MRYITPATIAYLHATYYIEGNKLFRRNLWSDDHVIVSGGAYPNPNSMMPIRITYTTIAYILYRTLAPAPLHIPEAKDYEPFPLPKGTRVRHLNCNRTDFSKANLIKTSPKPQLSDRG